MSDGYTGTDTYTMQKQFEQQTADTQRMIDQPGFAEHRASGTRAFFRGLGSGAFNGALMMGLYTAVIFAFALTPWGVGAAAFHWGATLTTAAIGIATTSLFGGVMAVKRAMSDTPSMGRESRRTIAAVPVISMDAAPSINQTVSLDAAPDQAPAKNWVAETGRGGDSQSRIQQILNDGALNDKDRASALLAAREAVASPEASAGRA